MDNEEKVRKWLLRELRELGAGNDNLEEKTWFIDRQKQPDDPGLQETIK
jgi:hypothetical protein